MMRKGHLLPLLCAVVVSLALPAGAAAKPGYFNTPPMRYAQADLTGSHGYRLQIRADAGGVSVTAQKNNGYVSYFATRARLAGERIDARLPGVGWVFLRFHERERGHRAPADNCKGPASLVRRGVFVGSVRIRGEHDFTSARSQHVLGKIVREEGSTCQGRAEARASNAGWQVLQAYARRGRGALAFTAFGFPTPDDSTMFSFSAALLRQRGPMSIVNQVGAPSESTAALRVESPPRSAAVDPPGPFTGTAAFQQESDKEFSWTGDLAVELPGIGEVSLAGPKFGASLCLDRRCRGDLDQGRSGGTQIAVFLPRAAAPTPSPWRWPGSLR